MSEHDDAALTPEQQTYLDKHGGIPAQSETEMHLLRLWAHDATIPARLRAIAENMSTEDQRLLRHLANDVERLLGPLAEVRTLAGDLNDETGAAILETIQADWLRRSGLDQQESLHGLSEDHERLPNDPERWQQHLTELQEPAFASEQTPVDRLVEALEAVRAEPHHTLEEVCERLGLDPQTLGKQAREKQLEIVVEEMMRERGDLFERLADE